MPGSIFPWQIFCLNETTKRYTALERWRMLREAKAICLLTKIWSWRKKAELYNDFEAIWTVITIKASSNVNQSRRFALDCSLLVLSYLFARESLVNYIDCFLCFSSLFLYYFCFFANRDLIGIYYWSLRFIKWFENY